MSSLIICVVLIIIVIILFIDHYTLKILPIADAPPAPGGYNKKKEKMRVKALEAQKVEQPYWILRCFPKWLTNSSLKNYIPDFILNLPWRQTDLKVPMDNLLIAIIIISILCWVSLKIYSGCSSPTTVSHFVARSVGFAAIGITLYNKLHSIPETTINTRNNGYIDAHQIHLLICVLWIILSAVILTLIIVTKYLSDVNLFVVELDNLLMVINFLEWIHGLGWLFHVLVIYYKKQLYHETELAKFDINDSNRRLDRLMMNAYENEKKLHQLLVIVVAGSGFTVASISIHTATFVRHQYLDEIHHCEDGDLRFNSMMIVICICLIITIHPSRQPSHRFWKFIRTFLHNRFQKDVQRLVEREDEITLEEFSENHEELADENASMFVNLGIETEEDELKRLSLINRGSQAFKDVPFVPSSMLYNQQRTTEKKLVAWSPSAKGTDRTKKRTTTRLYPRHPERVYRLNNFWYSDYGLEFPESLAKFLRFNIAMNMYKLGAIKKRPSLKLPNGKKIRLSRSQVNYKSKGPEFESLSPTNRFQPELRSLRTVSENGAHEIAEANPQRNEPDIDFTGRNCKTMAMNNLMLQMFCVQQDELNKNDMSRHRILPSEYEIQAIGDEKVQMRDKDVQVQASVDDDEISYGHQTDDNETGDGSKKSDYSQTSDDDDKWPTEFVLQVNDDEE